MEVLINRCSMQDEIQFIFRISVMVAVYQSPFRYHQLHRRGGAPGPSGTTPPRYPQ